MHHSKFFDESRLIFNDLALLDREVLVYSVVLFDVAFEICMHLVQEDVDFLQIGFGHLLDLLDPLVDHGGNLATLVLSPFTDQVLLEKEDFDALDQLLMTQLKIFVTWEHLEIRSQEVIQLPALMVTHYFRQVIKSLGIFNAQRGL